MSQEAQIAGWGLAIIAVVNLSLSNRKDPDALGLSLVILTIWVTSRVLSFVFAPPEHLQFAAVMDLMAAAAALGAWTTRRAAWKLALASLYGVQIAAAASFWLAQPTGNGFYLYILTLNVTFCLQLMCVGWPGVRHAWVASGAGSFVSWLIRRAHHLGA